MIIIGKRDVDPTLPSHVPGVHEGNWPGRARRKQLADGDLSVSTEPRRSTGVSPKNHTTIDPRMPKLTPP
jgi:hypothetical protein